jgi:hypothetical protein
MSEENIFLVVFGWWRQQHKASKAQASKQVSVRPSAGDAINF